MLLTNGELRVALATTHLPLREVSAAITSDSLFEIAGVLADALEQRFAIAAPRIAVCGLNPHAGEGGHLGDEELRIIGPAVQRMQEAGIRATGPLPADTVFVPRVLAGFDAVLAMYHDQGLPVVKHAGFDHAVNVTLGLPLIRTSPDHGTAFDLAGTGQADPGSLIAAVQLASRLARH
jgi:4-hydroxythreonine-4-phosphate dehydrogenase